jgi:D-alanyl-D-alanine carboxypeptidase (penicillin-binding protein 5/6)
MTKPASRLVVAALLGATTIFSSLTPAIATAQVYAVPQQAKYAAIVVDAASGEVLYARRADSPRYPASITKVMTLYLAFEQLAAGKLSLNDQVVVSPRAAAQPPSKLGVRAGDSITVNEAISALAVNSANDISVALAEKIGGTEQRFAALMTLKAQELGMTNTRFTNAHGLPDSRQLSSARDIAILSRP